MLREYIEIRDKNGGLRDTLPLLTTKKNRGQDKRTQEIIKNDKALRSYIKAGMTTALIRKDDPGY